MIGPVTKGGLILPLLGSVLVVLKALGLISLSWLWVLAPFWIPLALFPLLMPALLILLYSVATDPRFQEYRKIRRNTK